MLSGLRLEVRDDELSVTGTDLELSIRLSVKVGGDGDGAVVVPARLVADIVRSLPAGSVEVTEGEDELSISAGRTQFSIRPLSLDDYPVQPEPGAEAVTLPSTDVAEALRQVVRAASTDEARPVLTGVLIAAEDDGIRMVATDSYRLAVRDLPESAMLSSGQRVLVPSRALNELQRILGSGGELQVRLGARDAVFEVGATRLTTRLIEGDYPNYRNLLPSTYPEHAHRRARRPARSAASGEAARPGRGAGASRPRWRDSRADRYHPGRRATPSRRLMPPTPAPR